MAPRDDRPAGGTATDAGGRPVVDDGGRPVTLDGSSATRPAEEPVEGTAKPKRSRRKATKRAGR